MIPHSSIYSLKIHKGYESGSEIALLIYPSQPDSVRPCDKYSHNDEHLGCIRLPWMTQKELVKWLRKAADAVEKAELV